MLTQKRLKELVHYDPISGLFTRKVTTGRKAAIGDIAGGLCETNGYIFIRVDGIQYRAHRLAFLYMKGYIPEQIDHINHIKDDNRWCNIREVTIKENNMNMSKRVDNSSGVVGVNWHKASKKWVSQIQIEGKKIHLGLFTEFHEAVNARKNAEVLYGFHENHGK